MKFLLIPLAFLCLTSSCNNGPNYTAEEKMQFSYECGKEFGATHSLEDYTNDDAYFDDLRVYCNRKMKESGYD